MNKILSITLLLFGLNLAGQERTFNNVQISEDSTFGLSENKERVSELDNLIKSTQDFILQNKEKVELMAITTPASKPFALPDREWPDDVTTSINLLRGESGNPTYYAAYPISESGDWFIGYRYYFNESTGQVVAFERLANFFNSICVSGVAKELSTYYFSTDGKLIAKSYSVKDSDGNDLNNKECYFNYDNEYQIVRTVADLLE